MPAAKRSSPPPAARKSDPAPRGMPALTPPKQVQEPKQSLARSFYWSELRVGDDLPPLTKPAIDRVQIVRYAASSGDFNRLHLDEPYAHAVGFPGLFAPGMLALAFVGQLLTAWLRRGHVRKLGARFIKIVWPGDELTCRGRIAELRKEYGARPGGAGSGRPRAGGRGPPTRIRPARLGEEGFGSRGARSRGFPLRSGGAARTGSGAGLARSGAGPAAEDRARGAGPRARAVHHGGRRAGVRHRRAPIVGGKLSRSCRRPG